MRSMFGGVRFEVLMTKTLRSNDGRMQAPIGRSSPDQGSLVRPRRGRRMWAMIQDANPARRGCEGCVGGSKSGGFASRRREQWRARSMKARALGLESAFDAVLLCLGAIIAYVSW